MASVVYTSTHAISCTVGKRLLQKCIFEWRQPLAEVPPPAWERVEAKSAACHQPTQARCDVQQLSKFDTGLKQATHRRLSTSLPYSSNPHRSLSASLPYSSNTHSCLSISLPYSSNTHGCLSTSLVTVMVAAPQACSSRLVLYTGHTRTIQEQC